MFSRTNICVDQFNDDDFEKHFDNVFEDNFSGHKNRIQQMRERPSRFFSPFLKITNDFRSKL